MSLRKIVLIVAVVAIVLLVAFEPGAQKVARRLYNRTVGSWFDTPSWRPPGTAEITKVYVLRNGRRYHRKGCPELGGRRGVPTRLDKAKEMYQPCPVCDPPR